MAAASLLDVYVNDRLVGALGPTPGGAYTFTYLPDVPEDLFVSLTMPVRLASYTWSRGIPPFFLMNLPEGYQKDLLRTKLGPHAEVTDAGLLALTGGRTIGRVRVLPKGQPLAASSNDLEMSKLLASPDSREHLLYYLETGVAQGISGVMPKSLAKKVTVAIDNYIVKTAPKNLPGLAINEFLCLEVARKARLRVPAATLSQDGEVLAVHRFDRTANGESLGVEDFCALKGLDPANKYQGSLEDLARLMSIYVTPSRRAESAVQLFKLLLVNYALRNSDAHLKNYALIYTSGSDVTLAPVYDVVTVTAYPDFKDDIPGLTLSGRKVWRSGRLLHKFGALRLSLTASQMAACVAEVCSAIVTTAPAVRQHADAFPEFREIAKRMLDEWDCGALDIAANVTARSRPANKLRASVGLSDETPAPKEKKRRSNRNPDGGFSHKAR